MFFGEQIGNEDQSEVMFFGAASNEDRSKWMEAIRLGIFAFGHVVVIATLLSSLDLNTGDFRC